MSCSDTEEDGDLEPTLEIEMQGEEGEFAHKITSSDPLEVIWTGEKSPAWFQRKTLKVLAAIVALILFTLMVGIPTQKRRQKKQVSNAISFNHSADASGGDKNASSASGNIYHISGGSSQHGISGGSNQQGNLMNSTDVFAPLSTMDPVQLGLPSLDRPAQSQPPSCLDPLRASNPNKALHTNRWYQNLLLLQDGQSPTSDNYAYTMPYTADAAGSIPGLRLQYGSVDTSADQVIVSTVASDAVTLGASGNLTGSSSIDSTLDQGYSVLAATDLGVTLQWVRTSAAVFSL